MTRINLIFILGFLFLSNFIFAQKDSISDNYENFQYSFVYPLSTSGGESINKSFHTSFNILAGATDNVDIFELAGLVNVNRGDQAGTQFAGIANLTSGKSSGLKIAGIHNQSIKGGSGFFAAGLTNLMLDSVDAFLAAGIANSVKGNSKQCQLAGISNLTSGKMSGLQLAGISNFARKNSKGVQIAGIVNFVDGNYEGAQISGILNYAKTVKGCQLGFINIADSISGVPIGFLSFVKNGYKALEINTSESFYATLSFKTGVDRFYNIFSLSAKQIDDSFFWGFGYGVGTKFQLSDKFDIALELHSTNVNKDAFVISEFNSLNTLKMNALFDLGKKIQLSAGPSFNIFLSTNTNEEGELTGMDFAPWHHYNKTNYEVNTKMYFGFNAGIIF